MTPHFADDWLTVYQGDARTVLATLPAESVDCVVTSPPYWGLRDYGTATWSGGDEGCDHKPPSARRGVERRASTLEGGVATITAQDGPQHARAVCPRCGATRQDSQLGLEATPEEYAANLVGVFREVRRVLKATGTLWLNLGDSYATGGGAVGRAPGGGDQGERFIRAGMIETQPNRMPIPGLKPKDLAGIPWRTAFALQADGWYLRSDIIWAKPNPMPESVTDRPTKSHEYLFLLSKRATYYFDQDAVRESLAGPLHSPGNKPDVGVVQRNDFGTDRMEAVWGNPAGRNLRSVWTIATRPYPGAHFAVFPPELPERCIKAGSSERGVCPQCGAPWERVVERAITGTRHVSPKDQNPDRNDGPDVPSSRLHTQYFDESRTTTGWEPTCAHLSIPFNPVPATILDPFAGSGTVGLVANRLSRRAILIDLNAAYLEQQMQRNAQVPVGL